MGEKARRKRLFLAKNPFCCFCGGSNPATTEDHVPHRALFTGRRWPEGYVFPACENCNSATRLAEQVFSFLSRLYQDPLGQQEETELNQALDALGNNHPGIIRDILPIRSPTYRGRPAIQVNGPQVKGALEDYSRKLFSALHYREVGRILPQSGGIAWRWWSNAQLMDGELPAHFVARFRGEPTLMRQKEILKDQFNYRYTVTENGENGIYIAEFRQAFVIAGVVAFDYKFLEKDAPPDAVILRPLPG
jgi:hypothetical protein